MCGIAGIIRLSSAVTIPDLGERVATMTRVLHHRGPDDEGVYLSAEGSVGLGNRRLAIRDLSPAGHMPMGNAAGSVWITYNGEIYNTDELRPELERLGYSFHSQSDTEVILHGYEEWGTSVVDRLRGMFAFTIYDRRPQIGAPRLVLARDRLGIKPLYYAHVGHTLLFASELKAIVASQLVSREISPAGLAGYLMLGSVPNPLTIYRDIRGLEPSCTLTIMLDGSNTVPAPVPYWSLPTDEVSISHADAVGHVRALLEEAVRIRLVSDVPLGAFLSGGLDSSAVVALMRKATNGPIRTCSIVFDESEYSEAGYARAMARAVGAEHYERTITAQDMLNEWDNIMSAMDQPTVDGVNTYFVSQTAREAGLTVALSGLGGDELFGGYTNTFKEAPRIHRALSMAQSVPYGCCVARFGLQLFPDRHRWARVQDALLRPASRASAYLTRRGLFSPSEVQALLAPEVAEDAFKSLDIVRHIAERANSRLQPRHDQQFAWTTRAELRTYTHHQLLRDTDVMSMVHSLEVRVPLLDHRLVETLLRMSTSVKINNGGPKGLLSQAMGDSLPQSILSRREKRGFTFPFHDWLRGHLRDRYDGVTHLNGLFRDAYVAEVQQAFQQGKLHWSRPWALAALQGWMA